MVTPVAAVVGAGPAGLMAAERLAARGMRVVVYDQMASPARKFLMAGRGGLNLTHSEDVARFHTRYGDRSHALDRALTAFPPSALIAWANALGIETFVGSSGRVFPRAMKASPLLRAWLKRLDALGVTLALRHTWTGFGPDRSLLFETPHGAISATHDVTVLALGGASWPRLGSNGVWVALLARHGIEIAPLAAANCGVTIPWSDHVSTRMAGHPLKRITVSLGPVQSRGEVVITRAGLEGGAIYALSAAVRAATAGGAHARIMIDLRPDMTVAEISARLAAPRGKQSTSTFLRKALKLEPAAVAILREPGPLPTIPTALANLIKALPLTVTGCSGLDRAISTAGGVAFSELDDDAMLIKRPGVFVAGEMLDWEAPTGGYLLQACFATAVQAADGAAKWLDQRRARPA
jgi:uncharacterized flavoprotein (TIGR03862 family)